VITNLPVPQYSQRDPRWATQRLGTVNGTTIGGQGCLITCIAMMDAGFDPAAPWNPAQADDAFTSQAGYANGNLVIWNAINRILPNSKASAVAYCATSPAPVADICAHLDQGGLAILRVGFGGDPRVMHWVLAVGYTGGIGGQLDIIFHDPWTGGRSQFQFSNYGTHEAAKDILEVHYFVDGIPPVVVKPDEPVAKLPATHPEEATSPTTAPAPEPTPAPATPEPSPGQTGGVPNLKLVPTGVVWEYLDTPVSSVVQRDGAYAKDALNNKVLDETRPHLLRGTEVQVRGYFTYNGERFVRTQYAYDHDQWTGVPVIFFQPPDILEPETPGATLENGFLELPPEQRRSVLDLLGELVAMLASPLIKILGLKTKGN
jgi:hypothetical protein